MTEARIIIIKGNDSIIDAYMLPEHEEAMKRDIAHYLESGWKVILVTGNSISARHVVEPLA